MDKKRWYRPLFLMGGTAAWQDEGAALSRYVDEVLSLKGVRPPNLSINLNPDNFPEMQKSSCKRKHQTLMSNLEVYPKRSSFFLFFFFS